MDPVDLTLVSFQENKTQKEKEKEKEKEEENGAGHWKSLKRETDVIMAALIGECCQA